MRSSHILFRKLVPLASIALILASPAKGQVSEVTASTSTPVQGAGHDYIHLLSETVNPADGALSLRVDVPTPSGRQLKLPFSFAYDSNGVHIISPNLARPGEAIWGSNTGFLGSGGWTYGFPMSSNSSFVAYAVGSKPTNGATCYYSTGYVFQDPSGGRHALGLGAFRRSAGQGVCPFDGEYLSGGDAVVRASVSSVGGPVTVTDADGTRFSFPANNAVNPGAVLATQIEDRNGNLALVTLGPNPAQFSVMDTVGRTVLAVSGFGNTGDTVAVAGLANPYQLTWGSAPSNFSVTSTWPSGVGGQQYCAPIGPDNVSQPVVTAITLPNNQQYLFNYDPTYGELSKITYPSGGYVSYSWGLNPQSALTMYPGSATGSDVCPFIVDKPAVLHRYVSFDGSTIALQQDFSYTTTWNSPFDDTWVSKQTTVTTRDMVRGTVTQTIYAYSSVPGSDSPYHHTAPSDNQIPVEQSIIYKDSNGATLRTVTKAWGTYGNPFELACELQTLDSGQISGTFYAYGSGAQVTDKKEYDYGLIASTSACTPTNFIAPSITPTREIVTSYQTLGTTQIFDRPASIITYGGGSRLAETDYLYDQTAVAGVANLPTGTHDETNYSPTSTTPRGNATTATKQCFQGSTSCPSGNLTTSYTYDETGQVLTDTDPNNHTTQYSYADSYTVLSGGANVAYAPSANTNAYLTKITNPLSQIQSFTYDFNNGQLTIDKDRNNLITTFVYNDALARPTLATRPDGGQTTATYNDTAHTVTTSKQINTGQTITTVVLSDGVGHFKQTQLTSDPQGVVYKDTTYDGTGNVYTVSNPYRSGSDPTTTLGTTSYFYDAMGRKCLVVPPDGTLPSGGACPTTQPANTVFTTYSGNCITVTDQTGKSRKSCTDGLGRMTQVFEDPAGLQYETDYAYDALNNLLCAGQKGTASGTFTNCASIPIGWHPRTFSYDSLSRLLTSTNPETGTTTYKYDSDSNCASPNSFLGLLLSKTDARGIRSCAQYDVLNRGTVVNYSNGDPTITTAYDETNCLGLTACQNIGQRTSVTDAAGSESWAYQVDATNHRNIHVNKRTTSGITKSSTYYFDLAGNVTQVVYPTTRVVNYTFDAANRPKTAADGSSGITYATGFQTPPTGCLSGAVCYTPQGTFYALSIGQSSTFSGLNLTHTYNNRLQPNEFKASSTGGSAIDITYNFVDTVTTHNAGHVNSIANNLDTTRSQTFSYDSLNRITGALTASTYAISPSHCWGESYNVDAWGNLNSIARTSNSSYTGCSQETGFSTIADGNNHLPIFGYDASGNTSSDGVVTNYQWDAESQLKSAAGITYLYDSDGRRVSKSNGSVSQLYWYGSGGDILSETDGSGNMTHEYIFFAGKRVALTDGTSPDYYIEDMLGTSRVMTWSNGTLCYDADFYPYGGERAYTNTCPQNYKFEGKERDSETGNDDFGARYYSNRFGRWISADWSSTPVPVPYANLTNPQTLNLYSMVADDPETFADLDGHQDDSIWDTLMGYLGLSMRAYSPAADEQQRSSGQTLPGSDMTLNDALRMQNKANEEAAKQIQNFAEAIDPSPGRLVSTIGGRAVGTRTNGDVAMSVASIGLDLGVVKAIRGAQNIITNRFTTKTFQAAEQEAKGIVVKLRPDGKPFDHIESLRQGLQGLKNDATTLANALKNGGLSKAQQEAIQKNLGQINKAINETLKFFKKNNITP